MHQSNSVTIHGCVASPLSLHGAANAQSFVPRRTKRGGSEYARPCPRFVLNAFAQMLSL